MNAKKLIALLLVAILSCALLTACGEQEAPQTDVPSDDIPKTDDQTQTDPLPDIDAATQTKITAMTPVFNSVLVTMDMTSADYSQSDANFFWVLMSYLCSYHINDAAVTQTGLYDYMFPREYIRLLGCACFNDFGEVPARPATMNNFAYSEGQDAYDFTYTDAVPEYTAISGSVPFDEYYEITVSMCEPDGGEKLGDYIFVLAENPDYTNTVGEGGENGADAPSQSAPYPFSIVSVRAA